ncbi:hypothetical protein BV25DRAFT_1823270 [Artomyces pyxidatus]|uniref:Uncharacterized protein n=1 Tax=Artomyces pyxidatus TaxID=48021 RepID=A0ACB8T8F6_9AGAM|nr:hypothetical protein BV25DRAFT_1823270 [Artomyces pyxidatus]
MPTSHRYGSRTHIECLLRSHFPKLTDLSFAKWGPMGTQRAVQFLYVHPTIQRLVWSGEFGRSFRKDISEPFLPHLQYLKADSWTIPEAIIGGNHCPRYLSTLGCRVLSQRNSLPDLPRGSGRSVRRLTVVCSDVATLRSLADVFPSVTHLNVSGGLSFARDSGVWFHKAILASLEASKSYMDASLTHHRARPLVLSATRGVGWHDVQGFCAYA